MDVFAQQQPRQLKLYIAFCADEDNCVLLVERYLITDLNFNSTNVEHY